jgi:hypothetical protein
MAALGAAGDALAAKMAEQGDGDGAADVYLTVLGALMDGYLNRLCGDPMYPSFVPCTGFFQRIGSPNPDTVYRRAPIDAAAVYRLTGERGTTAEASLMPFEEPSMRSWPPFDLSTVAHGPDGAFDVLMSAERPAGHAGDWWKLEPGMTCLWLRSVSDRWGEERDPRITIARLGAPPRPRPAAPVVQGLVPLARAVERIVDYGVQHVEALAEAGFVNALKAVDYGAKGGMPLQWYREGVFDLADDEALLVEADMPPDCRYFSWSLTDRMLVTLDWMHAQTSLNKTQASIDPDGVLRVVVCGRDPGVRNWMDTTGYRSGVLQCRSVGCEQPPIFKARVVALGALAEHLPAQTERATAQQRAEALARRRAGSQLRSLW